MKEKSCTKCGKKKPLTEFFNEKRALDGKTSQCKKCSLIQQKEYYLSHRDERMKRCKDYYQNNKWKFILTGIECRCSNKSKHNYNRYGGRGIKCLITELELKELWFRDKAYEMEIPSIDRINNDGDYTFNNCRFLEHRENSAKDKRKPVIQYDLNGDFIKEWISLSEARRQLNIHHIDLCCNGKRPTAGGFAWRYINGK